ncbi:3-keto-disaccharide hydrolase [Neorhodopirellula pilleata]|uniref:3-keto-alpha-glucoside-1,2-lyase/3-keto-2-hydroxy-glucal hydratase domain-containing protein n=1 Tax=Neorhodopirellula pilleata TaxID=2714738 RepID=A0A5C5ZXG1_9BACT|nr:DUF1080 domain-containing protein [Neorhodopirellula pilleata]TWT91668.1 hypothetical protein Pla100_50870 [Neorhodopirellula pilleata]
MAFLLCLVASLPGCSPRPVPETQVGVMENAETSAEVMPGASTQSPDEPYTFEAEAYEASAEQLLDARLPIEQTTEGWIRLFDGHTLFGWAIAGEANWRVEDNAIVVDRGSPCFLNTTTRWSDYELELEFQADEETNSGIFVRTTMEPSDPAIDCFEINIAPPSNPFPTGGVVKRKIGKTIDIKAEQWHTMNILCDGERLTVKVNDQTTVEMDNAASPRLGYIGLQYRTGPIRFRNIRLRPIGFESLLDEKLSRWTRYDDMEGEFRVNDDGQLVVDGGKQQLESKETYGDFSLLVDYQMDSPESNSGIFFRAIPGDVMMGYECQVSNETVDGNPLQPADCGAGGIFRRQDARIVAGEPERWNTILLKAEGPHFAAWVNGLQVSDVYDDRAPDVNPRKGLRTDPGTIMIQGHDPTTQATYRQISIKPQPAEN